jgi:predicted ATPase
VLGEGFKPNVEIDSYRSYPHIVESDAKNLLHVLSFLKKKHSELFVKLSEDLSYLLDHVSGIDIQGGEEPDILGHFIVQEKSLQGQEAPTISAGTSRLIAILAAYYALDMTGTTLPGVVVVEEPDTALHPLLFGRFVDLLRTYTSREDVPRQFILTTHNPYLLNFFQPEEVRIVERGEDGFTTVKELDREVINIWKTSKPHYGIGDIWVTRTLGGVPE